MLPRTPGASPRILVADDDDLLSEVLARALDGRGYLVSCAPRGVISAGLAPDFDLVVLDAHIPGVDFASTLRFLRDSEIAVLVVSGDSTRPPGVDDDEFLSKPIELDRLLAAVRRLASPASAA